jgi:hypothetical protein
MGKKWPWMAFFVFLFLSCRNTKTGGLAGQISLNFSNHIHNIDTALNLDSFHLIRTDTFYEKQGRMLDVFIYQREENKVRDQMQHAAALELPDSAAFYNYEDGLLLQEIDSLKKLVPKADTTHPFGLAVFCIYWVRKNGKALQDSVLYFFDNNMRLLDPDRVDTAIARSSRKL